ncbi:hypothetical protein L7F22_037772, partial [Adiantum nelumboides]|nr:hypothetical protein [Adiantum nelumboides]
MQHGRGGRTQPVLALENRRSLPNPAREQENKGGMSSAAWYVAAAASSIASSKASRAALVKR